MDSSVWTNKARYFIFARRKYLSDNSPAKLARRKAMAHAERIAELTRRAASIPQMGGEGVKDGPSLFKGETYRYGEAPLVGWDSIDTSHD